MNAKKEMIRHLEGKPKVKCAHIRYGSSWEEENQIPINLKIGYSEQEFLNWLDSLSFDYDSGYGGQYVFGLVWFEDGTWLERGEYDGSEWWEYKKSPEIPENLY